MQVLPILATFILLSSASGDLDDDDDAQNEFLLPYSETEDVDFHITRPAGSGCYQWSTNNTEVIKLAPIQTDYKRMCGHKLEFQIIPGTCKDKTTITLVAENLDLASGYDADSPTTIEYLVHVHPLARLEVLSLRSELNVGEDPQPFGIVGYDDEDEEFDTLDGIQLSWFIGSKKDVASFEAYRPSGPIVKLIPKSSGSGSVIAVVDDPNYAEVIEPAMHEFSVAAPLAIEPDGVFLLQGGVVHFSLLESGVDSDGKVSKNDLEVGKEDSEYKFEVKEPEFASIDVESGNVTALKEGETALLVKDKEGNVVKAVPLRVTTAHSVTLTSHPDPESKQLILGHEYDIKITIFNRDEREIYPSENILCKLIFPSTKFEVVSVADNGLSATVRAVGVGIGKIKASLRSVLAEDDEELEILPHIKGSTDFEIYESVVIKPRETILAWDASKSPSYELTYTASGGGKVYAWSTSNSSMATVDTEGKVTTHGGPGTFTVRVAMVKGQQNYDEAMAYILPVKRLELKRGTQLETATHTPITLAVRMLTFLDDEADETMFTDCADVPYNIALSDTKNFAVEGTSERGHNHKYDSCASFTVRANVPGATCKVTVTYDDPASGQQLKDSLQIASYRALEMVHPRPDSASKSLGKKAPVLLAVGSTARVVFRGGPMPWAGKPSGHFHDADILDGTTISLAEVSAEGADKDVYAYDVTCLKLGATSFTFTVGNAKSATNPNPTHGSREVNVRCDEPAKLVVKAEPLDPSAAYVANPKSGKIMAHNDKDLLLSLTVKNKDGATFHDVSSVDFAFKISDADLIQASADKTVTNRPEKMGGEFGTLTVPGKPFMSFSPSGKKGDVTISAMISGYNEGLLSDVGATKPPPLPKVVWHSDDDDEDYDEDDEDENFIAHAHAMMDELDFTLTVESEINAVRKPNAK